MVLLSTTPALEEGGSDFRDDDYILLSTSMPARELTKEEQLSLALNFSTDMALGGAGGLRDEPPL